MEPMGLFGRLASMARYYFHLHECGTVIADEDGCEHNSVDSMQEAARKAARDVMCGEVMQGRLCLGCRVEVVDAQGRLVFDLPFRDALAITGL